MVDGAGESGAKHLPSWEGLNVSSVLADRGSVVPTDLVVSINLRLVNSAASCALFDICF